MEWKRSASRSSLRMPDVLQLAAKGDIAAHSRYACVYFVAGAFPALPFPSLVASRLFVLPTVPSEVGPVATLPAKEDSLLPRAKPVPAPKVPILTYG